MSITRVLDTVPGADVSQTSANPHTGYAARTMYGSRGLTRNEPGIMQEGVA